MNIFECLKEELMHLEEVCKKCMQDIKKAPKGTIHLHFKNGGKNSSWYYYYKGKSTYFSVTKSENLEVLRKLSQKAYARKVLNVAMGQKTIIERFLFSFNPKAISEVYEHLAKEKKQYIEPFRTLEQEEKKKDGEMLKLMQEMSFLCDEFLKRKMS